VTGREVELPPGYPELLDDLKRAVGEARWRAQRVVNTELLALYWRIGHTILDRQDAEGWGARVIDRLSTDLRAAYPDMRGLSRSNLFYMRSFAASWPQEPIVQQAVGRLPWGHVTVLLDKLHDQPQRDWYAAAAAENGWSRNVLLNQIMNRLHERTGAAPSNFAAQLPAKDSELAQQLTRDPYVLDFLELTGPAAERDLEAALVKRLQAFLLELGHGFAFVGRQYHFTVDGDDFYIDLLFFNWSQSRFVVVELKVGRFAPEHAGQLGFYVAWVDANLRVADRHAPTIGILLCAGRNDSVVRYALAGSTAPLAVADYTYDALPPAARAAVPTEAELADAAGAVLDQLTANAGLSADDSEAGNDRS
jgi:predicted nuclease of restriction endonuclease-like (RecB) superfamily